MGTTRREFLRYGAGGGAALLASGWTLPGFLSRTAMAAGVAPDVDGRVLVVIQMSGGNDGLNTVIPYRDDAYHRARPTLRITPDRILKLDDALGLHPDMTGLKRLYDDGLLHVVTNVGYPNPDRSHFRSMDIWHTARMQPEGAEDGWLGRVVDAAGDGTRGRGEGKEEACCALHLDDEALPLALKARGVAVPSVRSIEAFRLSDAAKVQAAVSAPRGTGSRDDLLFVQRVAVSSCSSAKRLEHVAASDAPRAKYPDLPLASRLRQIAQLIGAGFGARVYYTSIGGFDTHAKQALAHGPLLRELADSVAAMFEDLKSRGLADRVVLMTFSEFGRRVKENGSQGTDHGAAAPMFIAGGACAAGISGGAPDLADLIDGDVKHRVDFRQVYGAMVEKWLGLDQRAILGERYEPISALRT
jgi:uncharacterized protein (DUF1501 family)